MKSSNDDGLFSFMKHKLKLPTIMISSSKPSMVVPIYDFSETHSHDMTNLFDTIEYKSRLLVKSSAVPLSFCAYYLFDKFKKDRARKQELV
jgi:hypothetical protein